MKLKTDKEIVEVFKDYHFSVFGFYPDMNQEDIELFVLFRKNPRTRKAHVNTAIHEALHLWGFSHGDNYSRGKENSVNYKVGDIAEKYVDECSNVIITSGLN